jgi:hypothetical protein
MRHSLLAFLLLAALPAAPASAETFARYYPASGDLSFSGVDGGIVISIQSLGGRLSPNVVTFPIELTPRNAHPPVSGFQPPATAYWRMLHAEPFDFDMLSVKGAILPHTPVSDLVFWFRPNYAASGSPYPIVAIPEPSTIAIAATSLVGIACIRRRNRPLPAPA